MVTSSNRPSLKLVGSSTKNVKVLQLKVELQGVRPKVWRRVLVPAGIRLPLQNFNRHIKSLTDRGVAFIILA